MLFSKHHWEGFMIRAEGQASNKRQLCQGFVSAVYIYGGCLVFFFKLSEAPEPLCVLTHLQQNAGHLQAISQPGTGSIHYTARLISRLSPNRGPEPLPTLITLHQYICSIASVNMRC